MPDSHGGVDMTAVTRKLVVKLAGAALGTGAQTQEAVMKKSLTRRVPLLVTMLTAAHIVVGWGVASAGPCIP